MKQMYNFEELVGEVERLHTLKRDITHPTKDVILYSDSTYPSGLDVAMTEDIESQYREIFAKLKTRKQFLFIEVKNERLKVERVDDICGQKENRPYFFDNAGQLEEFVKETNEEEVRYQKTLESNQMPYR